MVRSAPLYLLPLLCYSVLARFISDEDTIVPIECKCTAEYCTDDSGTCTAESGSCFYLAEESRDPDRRGVYEVTARGCTHINESFFFCAEQENNIGHQCCQFALCNDITWFTKEPTASESFPPTKGPEMPPPRGPAFEPNPQNSLTYPLYIVGIFVFIIAMTLGGMLVLRFCRVNREKVLVSNSLVTPLTLPHYITPGSTQNWQSVPSQDFTTSCSSGSGNPRLIEKTLIREITFCERIGKGRYGEVWRGRWRAGGQVAVKVFSNREEASWWHEAEMYQSYWLRHENILSFIGADQRDCVANMEYYLVLNFHPRGSLYDFLQDAQLTVQDSLQMILSLAAGLDYLHTEIRSSVAKPSIAHRDIKSKNILIKSVGQGSQCCIADFGLAARSDFFDNLPDKKKFHFQVGTRRYMAPEILDSSINLSSFQSLRQADIYMFGLVAWEIGQRVSPGTEPYQYPFQHDVPCDPTIEEMSAVVVDTGKRPPIPDSWSKHHTLIELSRITSECWDKDPTTRLTSLRIRKDLMRLLDSLLRVRDSGCYFTDASDQGFQSWD